MNGGEHVAEILKSEGVQFGFTLAGGHIAPILVAAKARGIRVIDVRHEANAVFAASGWSAEITDDEILANLPALNLECAR